MRVTREPDVGETLIEVLIAFIVLALFTPALILGMIFTITSTGTFRAAVNPTNNAGLILDNWSDLIDQKAYLACAPASWAPDAPVDPTTSTTTWTPAASPQYWDTSTQAFTATCVTDSGLQLWTLTVTTKQTDSVISNVQSVKVVKRNPCGSGCSS